MAQKLLIGLIGSGIQRSLSPAMHEEKARHHNLRLHYQIIDLDRTRSTVADLPNLIAAARTMGFAGLNCSNTIRARSCVIVKAEDGARLNAAGQDGLLSPSQHKRLHCHQVADLS